MKTLEITILVAAILISVSVILKQSWVALGVPMDQHFVETVNLQLRRRNGHWVFQYPNLQNARGISSSLSAGLYKLIIPTNHENLNWHFRIFSMATLLLNSFSLPDVDPQKSQAENSNISDYCYIGLPVSGAFERSDRSNISESASDCSTAIAANLTDSIFFDLVWPWQGRTHPLYINLIPLLALLGVSPRKSETRQNYSLHWPVARSISIACILAIGAPIP
jgi:hypothetical protein